VTIGILLFGFVDPTCAQTASVSAAIDQANDGDFCKTIYSCVLSSQEIELLDNEDGLDYQIKDHAGVFTTGTWPQIYFAPDRYLLFDLNNPNLSPTDVILDSSIHLIHQVNQVEGSKGVDYDIKFEASVDSGQTWEILSTDLWPSTPNVHDHFQVTLPQNYLNSTYLNQLSIKLSLFGDDGQAQLSSIIDLVSLDINFYDPLTNLPPTQTITSPATPSSSFKDSFTFEGTATDDFGITEYELNLLDENSNLIVTCLKDTIEVTNSIVVSCSIDTSLHQDGQYFLRIKSKDNAGEWSSSSLEVTFDNTPPVTDSSSLTPPSDTFWENPITISGTSSDNLVVDFVNLYFKKSDSLDPLTSLTTLTNSIASSIFSWSYSWDPTSGPGEGSYDLAVTATDLAGNEESVQTLGQKISFVPSLFPIISNILGTTPAFGQVKVTWNTQLPTSGRVVYDIVSHPLVNPGHLNYGYAFSSDLINSLSPTTFHTILLNGLSDSTIYYYRIISTSSPTTVGPELTNKTFSPSGSGSSPNSSSPSSSSYLATILATPSPIPSSNEPRWLSTLGVDQLVDTKVPQTSQKPIYPPISTPTPSPQVLGTTTDTSSSWLFLVVSGVLVWILTFLAFRKR
jgi:hypothetical protein